MNNSSASTSSSASPLNIVVGVAGGIAAYKACHLIRDFTEGGDSVRVVPTPTALNFVGAATFEALSGQPVSTSVFDAVDRVQHVDIGQRADAIVVAPATADLIARVAGGRADDLLTATILVATCPVVIAPAMHTEMWLNPATQDNVATLRRRGIVVLEPAQGRLTGSDSGPGRLLEPGQIAQLVRTVMAGYPIVHDWVGKKVVISAGGTQENLDPVRYLGNRSSGRQGFALAELAAQRGADVTVVAGNVEQLPTPAGARIRSIVSAQQLEEVMGEESAGADIIIMSAAVSDYRPRSVAGSKLKKGKADAELERLDLVLNPDVLAGLVAKRERAEINPAAIIVGFAAETGDAEHSALDFARMKFQRKGCDLLMANAVGQGKVFGQATNEGWLLRKGVEPTVVEKGSKQVVAAQILDAVAQLMGH
ncbi:bifunctional phosphopantothenoylcysteine decarboxylase/phosphopantothenate--cysteine ligase CoaBC [Corynebacterium flavescens]